MFQQNSGSGWPAPVFHNPEVSKLSTERYTRTELNSVRQTLVDHGTMSLHAYLEGGVSAVTPLVSLLKLESTAKAIAELKGDQKAIAAYLADLHQRINR